MEKHLKGLNNSLLSLELLPERRDEPKIKIRLRSINSGRPLTNAFFNREQLRELIHELQQRLDEMPE